MLEDRLKAEMIEKDRQYAVWAQSQIDQAEFIILHPIPLPYYKPNICSYAL